MAVVFGVSLKHWTGKMGLPQSDYEAIVAGGFKPVYKGASVALMNAETEDLFGLAKTKTGSLECDTVFTLKYKELVGHTPGEATTFKKVQAEHWKAEPKADIGSSQAVQTGVPVSLSKATQVGIKVAGTSSVYRVFMISDDCNIAYNWDGSSLSLRAEKFTPAAREQLQKWGLEPKVSGSLQYASCHISKVSDKDLVFKTLGSLAASVLTKEPTAMLMKGNA